MAMEVRAPLLLHLFLTLHEDGTASIAVLLITNADASLPLVIEIEVLKFRTKVFLEGAQ